MTEEDKNDTYIICNKGRSKYINDEKHINNDFVCTRLEMIYKPCVRCRAINKNNCNTYPKNIMKQAKSIMKTIEKKGNNIINNTERKMLIG